jgi:SCY1-like protein 1
MDFLFLNIFNQDDGSPVSIFSLSGSSSQDRHLAAGRNGVKRLRTVSLWLHFSSLSSYDIFVKLRDASDMFQVRHPNILSFLHSTEVEGFDGPSQKHTIYIVTEPVMPLSEKLKELNLGGTQR